VIRKVTKPGPEGLARAADCGHFVEIMACPSGCLNGGGQIPEPKMAPPPASGDQDAATSADGSAVATSKPSAAAQSRDGRKRRLGAMQGLLHDAPGVAVVRPEDHPLVLPLYRRIAALSAADSTASKERAATPSQPEALASLDRLVGGAAARRWLGAEWRSLKVDDSGKAIVGASSLKW